MVLSERKGLTPLEERVYSFLGSPAVRKQPKKFDRSFKLELLDDEEISAAGTSVIIFPTVEAYADYRKTHPIKPTARERAKATERLTQTEAQTLLRFPIPVPERLRTVFSAIGGGGRR